jgi:hypothetical protein
MKKVILSLIVLGSMAAGYAAEEAETPVVGSEGGSKPSSSASGGDVTPIPEGELAAKQGVTVEGTREKPEGDDAGTKVSDAGKKAKGKEVKDSKEGKCCVVQ